jgi:hypothetical protein
MANNEGKVNFAMLFLAFRDPESKQDSHILENLRMPHIGFITEIIR